MKKMHDYQVSPVKFSSLPLSTSCVLACSYRASETNKHPSSPGPHLSWIFYIMLVREWPRRTRSRWFLVRKFSDKPGNAINLDDSVNILGDFQVVLPLVLRTARISNAVQVPENARRGVGASGIQNYHHDRLTVEGARGKMQYIFFLANETLYSTRIVL